MLALEESTRVISGAPAVHCGGVTKEFGAGETRTAALDQKSGQTVMALLRRVAVQPGRAVMVVSHDSRVFGFGDRIVYMNDGQVERVADQIAA